MEPDELEDAAVPHQHHLEEAHSGPLRVLVPGVDFIKPFRPKFTDKTLFGQI
jgi:hypothetical protein